MAWYPEYKKKRGLVVTGACSAKVPSPRLTPDEIAAMLDDGKLYDAGHPVTLARYKREVERQKEIQAAQLSAMAENGDGINAASVIGDSLKPYNCPALGQRITSRSQIKRIQREYHERTGERLREFV